MSPETRRAALAATARVAMCVSVGACNGKASPEPIADVPATEPAAKRDAASCATVVEEAWGDADKRTSDIDDAELKACCQTIADERDAAGNFGSDWADRTHCCSLLEWQGSSTCTPWGPPVPPAMA